MKVLLISPKDPDQPGNLKYLMGGENTFTRSLLANPPQGVEYIHYQDALRQGKAIHTDFQRLLSTLMTLGIYPPDVGFQCLKLCEKFDLVHGHAFSLRLENYSGPVVLSDSSSNWLFLKDYLSWNQWRISCGYKLRKLISQKFNLYDPNLNLGKAKKLIIWSEFAKKIHQDLGADSPKIVVIPPGIDQLPGKRIKHDGFNILFVGVWFERKGGLLLLEVYKVLKKKYPQIRLNLIGEIPKGLKLFKDVWQKNYLPREKLVKEIFPWADVLVLVPPKAEGYGLVVLEAASLGIPAIVSSVYALPELVEDGKTGFVISLGNLAELSEKLEILIKNRDLGEKMGEAARKRFLEKFWIVQTNKKLLRVYKEAMVR